MHNSVIRKSSLLYIFQNQRLTTLVHSFPVHSPSLSAITLPLHSPATLSLALCNHASSVSPTLHQSPSPFSISRRCRYPGALSYPFRTLTVPAAVDYRYIALPFYCFVLHLFCGKWMFIRGGSRITKIFNFFHLFYGYNAGSDFALWRKDDNKC